MSVAAPSARIRRSPRTRSRGRGERRFAYAAIAPAAVLLLVFLVIPTLLAFALGFTNARLISPNPPQFTGADNFVRLSADPLFWRSLGNTAYFVIVVVPVQAALGLLLALFVNRRMLGTTLFRTAIFIPVVTSMVVVSILWIFLYRKDGLVNAMIGTVVPGHEPVAWLGEPETALPAIILMSVWQGVGFHMVVWLSGLQTIPGELYEAAKIDGAGLLRSFASVTWPGLRPTAVFVLVTITIAALGLFVQIDVMTGGGPLDSTTTLVFLAFETGYGKQALGYGSAIALVFFLIVLAVSLLQRRLVRERG